MPNWCARIITSVALALLYFLLYLWMPACLLVNLFLFLYIYIFIVEFLSIAPKHGLHRYLAMGYITGAFIILTYWSAYDETRYLVALSLLLSATVDIGSYVAGMLWGKHKLAPSISPGKTWEGVCGGWAMTTCLLLTIFSLYKPLSACLLLVACTASLIVTAVGLSGDLYISCLKRRARIKDTGTCLPGHGGLLDRYDGTIAVVWLLWLIY